ncbi:PTS system, fructose-specific IIC component [Cetobacterium ceti]|uniref:PTS system, fructose-specific IIC component n=1 Tax=Cetobacterium ceti TaxID=180163 RepID=A0A1T4MTL7_9FUSO|nr:fructose-specific PTS transporter subunit EIIC [Cetobacterium ceti]SJZ70332.1 PTS system, fructose-specific IIC component [Cetobacterium ceti]
MIKNMLSKECINLNLKATTKSEVIDELIDILFKANKLSDKEEFKKVILAREAQSSTGLEEGIAIPHGKTSAVKVPSIAFGLSKGGIDYDSLDGEPSKLFFMIAAPANANDTHIETLSQLTTLLLDDDVREKLLNCKNSEDVFNILDISKKEEENISLSNNEKYDILAVTACPTGIAHTYMAAEALIKKAKEMNISIKVETNGSTGIKNLLTNEEIKNAKGIIVAADKNVEINRFNGKHVDFVPVKDGIKRPEELINRALKGEAPIFKGSSTSSNGTSSERKGFYKHLMSGVSNMLPFVVGGGILIALSFIFGIKSADPNDPSFSPIAKLLMDIGGGNAFFLMVPVLAGFIGMSIADRPGFAPAMIAGLISVNHGGGFLGGLVGGFLGGYVVLGLKRLFAKLPESLEGIKPVLLYPLFGIFITGALMYLVVINPIAALNSGMTNFLKTLGTGNLVLLGVILGGMMAIDMGGPINKAAFTFGIAAIAAGNYYPHAAVMAGGMVPPLGLALATTFFKNKFTKDEREAGKINYIMGASFITEGAIPFAAADPMRVIPACMIGSGLAGGLAMYFKCALPAPHGGLFVLPIITHPFLYLISVILGSIITAIIVGFTKPKKI